uniref:Uncharacterized protein n=1 Tax=Zea mays TaxID=4577 RepID=A0A804N6N4_MAIZE
MQCNRPATPLRWRGVRCGRGESKLAALPGDEAVALAHEPGCGLSHVDAGAGEVMTAAAKAKSHWYVCSSPPRLVKSREMAAVVLHPAILRCICLFPSLSLTLAAAGAGASHHSLFLLESWGLGCGMDLLKVRQVILFDLPNSIDEYIH